MRQSTKRFLSQILALVFVFFAFIIFLNFIKPTYKEIQVLRSEIFQREENIQKRKFIVNQVKALIREYQDQSQLHKALDATLPLKYNTAEALLQISGLLDSNNLNLVSFNISKPIVNNLTEDNFKFLKPTGSFDISLKIRGNYNDFQKFLSQLENNIRLFSIKNVNISRVESEGKAGSTNKNLLFDIILISYYQVVN